VTPPAGRAAGAVQRNARPPPDLACSGRRCCRVADDDASRWVFRARGVPLFLRHVEVLLPSWGPGGGLYVQPITLPRVIILKIVASSRTGNLVVNMQGPSTMPLRVTTNTRPRLQVGLVELIKSSHVKGTKPTGKTVPKRFQRVLDGLGCWVCFWRVLVLTVPVLTIILLDRRRSSDGQARLA
jgi:hypothetical protein